MCSRTPPHDNYVYPLIADSLNIKIKRSTEGNMHVQVEDHVDFLNPFSLSKVGMKRNFQSFFYFIAEIQTFLARFS